MGPAAKRTIVVLVGMVVLLASGAVPAFAASKLAACAMVGLRVLSVDDAYRAVLWTMVVLVGAMIAVSAAVDVGVSPRPVLMSVAVAAAASFLTPAATPANLMVIGPGGYRFGNYWRLGLCVLALFVVATFLVAVIWSF
jgi:di/tricarboxylate transporter